MHIVWPKHDNIAEIKLKSKQADIFGKQFQVCHKMLGQKWTDFYSVVSNKNNVLIARKSFSLVNRIKYDGAAEENKNRIQQNDAAVCSILLRMKYPTWNINMLRCNPYK